MVWAGLAIEAAIAARRPAPPPPIIARSALNTSMRTPRALNGDYDFLVQPAVVGLLLQAGKNEPLGKPGADFAAPQGERVRLEHVEDRAEEVAQRMAVRGLVVSHEGELAPGLKAAQG